MTDLEAPESLPRAWALDMSGDSSEARASARDAADKLQAASIERSEDPRLHSALGLALALLGEREAAVAAGRRAVELLPVEHDAYEGPSYVEHLAAIHARLGDVDVVVELLEQQLVRPSRTSVPLLRLDPRWDPVRQEPACENLLETFESRGPGD